MLMDGGIEILAEGIASNASLETIRLGNHGIGPDGIAALGHALMTNQTITKVVLWEEKLDELKKAELEAAGAKMRQDLAAREPSIEFDFTFK